MKQYIILPAFALLLASPVFAQVKPSTPPSDIREKLVALAVQNPELEIADHQIKIAKYNLKGAKGWWINNISLSFNANEFTIKRLTHKQNPETGGYYPNFYPFYNVGVNIPIGGIFTQPAKVKAARESVAIAQANRNETFRQVKSAVLSAYENYLSGRELLTIQNQIAESTYNEFLQAKQKFRNGEISIVEYNAASEAYHKQLKDKIGAQHALNLTKIRLEALIGVPLSSVLQNNPGSGSTTDHTSPDQP